MTDKDNEFAGDQFKPEDRGFAEVEAAIKEIERLKNSEEDEDVFQQNPQEEDQEEEDESAEEEDQEEEEDLEKESLKENVKKPEKAWKEKKRRFKAQSETRAALEEKRKVLEENARLKEMLRQAESAGTYQYSKNVYSELDRAKQFKKKAIDEGDVDAVIEADVQINKVLHNINELEKWSTYENSQSHRQEHQQQIDQNQEVEWQIAQQWLSTHRDLQAESKHFDQELAAQVAEYIYALDRNIDASGTPDIKYSDRYFDTIDDYIDDLKSKRRSDKTQKNIGSMGNVGGVRNSYNNSLHNTNKTQKVALTPYEKELARIGGISEEDWVRRKINISKTNR